LFALTVCDLVADLNDFWWRSDCLRQIHDHTIREIIGQLCETVRIDLFQAAIA
jgi:hypothetical protein